MTPLLLQMFAFLGAFSAGCHAVALMFGGRVINLFGMVLCIGLAIYFSARSLWLAE